MATHDFSQKINTHGPVHSFIHIREVEHFDILLSTLYLFIVLEQFWGAGTVLKFSESHTVFTFYITITIIMLHFRGKYCF